MPQLMTEATLKKVLVIDDSVQTHHAYRIMLNRYKCTTITARNGHEALSHLMSNSDIDLFIVDMNRPHMSGSKFIRRVRELGSYEHIPTLLISSSGIDPDAGEALAFAQGNLTKPFTSTELHAAIGKLIQQAAQS